MLADADLKDFDLSHLKPVLPDEPEESRHRDQIPALAYGLIISLAVHAAMVVSGWNFKLTAHSVIPEQPLRVELKYIPAGNIEPVEDQAARKVDTDAQGTIASAETPSQEVVQPESSRQDTLQQNISQQQMPEQSIEAPARIIHGLSPQELRGLVQEFKSHDQPAYGIGQNVFNPALRKRLMDEAGKPQLQRADVGPKTYTDPSGATVVDVGNGKCLRSSVANKPGETQNWYMTSCGGKSESERIMERVDQAVNGKLRFD